MPNLSRSRPAQATIAPFVGAERQWRRYERQSAVRRDFLQTGADSLIGRHATRDDQGGGGIILHHFQSMFGAIRENIGDGGL